MVNYRLYPLKFEPICVVNACLTFARPRDSGTGYECTITQEALVDSWLARGFIQAS
jgi:hypothetical protein